MLWVFGELARCHQTPNQRSCSSLFGMLGLDGELWFCDRVSQPDSLVMGGGLGAAPPVQSSWVVPIGTHFTPARFFFSRARGLKKIKKRLGRFFDFAAGHGWQGLRYGLLL
jgi:hypothetical protein